MSQINSDSAYGTVLAHVNSLKSQTDSTEKSVEKMYQSLEEYADGFDKTITELFGVASEVRASLASVVTDLEHAIDDQNVCIDAIDGLDKRCARDASDAHIALAKLSGELGRQAAVLDDYAREEVQLSLRFERQSGELAALRSEYAEWAVDLGRKLDQQTSELVTLRGQLEHQTHEVAFLRDEHAKRLDELERQAVEHAKQLVKLNERLEKCASAGEVLVLERVIEGQLMKADQEAPKGFFAKMFRVAS